MSSEPPSLPLKNKLVRRRSRRLVAAFEAFFRIEAASGIVLIASAVVALVLANVSARPVDLTHAAVPLGPLGALHLHFVINDGLMTVFFLVVGLEIRREMHEGALSSFTRASLPVAAALGGMLAPALLYTAIAGHDPAQRRGWGIPMATDIAFAVGCVEER